MPTSIAWIQYCSLQLTHTSSFTVLHYVMEFVVVVSCGPSVIYRHTFSSFHLCQFRQLLSF